MSAPFPGSMRTKKDFFLCAFTSYSLKMLLPPFRGVVFDFREQESDNRRISFSSSWSFPPMKKKARVGPSKRERKKKGRKRKSRTAENTLGKESYRLGVLQ
jgi:hypothetical protein